MGVRAKNDEANGSSSELDAEVLVVGAGPTGLMLAAELALGGVDALVVERRPDQQLAGTRARGLSARTLEVLDQRGVADRFLAAGEPAQVQTFGTVTLDISDLPTRYPHGLALLQARIEALLAEWVDELPVRVRRGVVTAVRQDAGGVEVTLEGGATLRARYVVGCDGGRSLVRREAGIAFPGWDATTSYLIAEAEMPSSPELGFKQDAIGRHAIGPNGGGDRVGVVVQEVPPRPGDSPSLQELRDAVVSVWGSDFGLHSATWISRFSDAARQAEVYRRGRVLVAGDAAHVHSPVGGQGLNTGLQDAVNLGWKLAQVVRGHSPEGLLDTYDAERRPVGARVLQGTMATTLLTSSDGRTAALRDALAGVLAMDEPRRALGARFAGLDIAYDLGDGLHPLVGRRIPDLRLSTAEGPIPLFTLLHAARAVLIDLGGAGAFDLAPWGDRVDGVAASYDGAWELPVLGAVPAPPAVLVRPDGYVAWAGELGDPALPRALTKWCGEPAPS
jgi:2-polyprenyl-6-methoxyphenol hydroxylase-like FAD-dependent oxidoreductase